MYRENTVMKKYIGNIFLVSRLGSVSLIVLVKKLVLHYQIFLTATQNLTTTIFSDSNCPFLSVK